MSLSGVCARVKERGGSRVPSVSRAPKPRHGRPMAGFCYGTLARGWGTSVAPTAADVNRDQELRHLAQANRHIAEVKRHIALQQNTIAKLRLAKHPTEVAESMLEALKGSLRVFGRHRELILSIINESSLP